MEVANICLISRHYVNIGICVPVRLLGISAKEKRNENIKNIIKNPDFGLDFLLPGKSVQLS